MSDNMKEIQELFDRMEAKLDVILELAQGVNRSIDENPFEYDNAGDEIPENNG